MTQPNRPLIALAAALLAVASARPALAADAAADTTRPNILWISVEDISADVGCYGVDYAKTPTLDKLAADGVRFTRMFAHAGVCACARTGIITGMYPSTIGTNHMRCQGSPPAIVKCFPEYLRAAGYFCTNRSKTDYQFPVPPTAWDREGNKHKDWAERPAPGTPFFSVINLTTTHESQVWPRGDGKTTLDPAKVRVPAYYPDTPTVRRDIAQYNDNIARVDGQIADILDRLDKDELTDSTIVVFWSDHGAGLTRAKRWLYDSGTHVPAIIRVPPRYRKLVGLGEPGTTHDEMVAFVDLAPTMLSLAGVPIPPHMQGRAFAGPRKGEPRDDVFGARDRMDERYELIRMCRDKRYLYIRNYMPWMTRGQHLEYMDRMPMLREMRTLYAAGKLEGAEAMFLEPTKPVEELYDTEADPDNVVNLAGDAAHAQTLKRMRERLEQWRRETGDAGMIPEPMLDRMYEATDKAVAPRFARAPGGKVAIGAAMACPSIDYRIDGGAWAMYTGPIAVPDGATLEARANGINRGAKTAKLDPSKLADALPEPVEEIDHWRRVLNNSTLLDELTALHSLDPTAADAKAAYLKALSHDHPAMRYWGVTLLHHNVAAADAAVFDAIGALLKDADPTVRIAAGYALADRGRADAGLPALIKALEKGDRNDRLFAANALDYLDEKARPARDAMKAARKDDYGYVARVIDQALAELNEK